MLPAWVGSAKIAASIQTFGVELHDITINPLWNMFQGSSLVRHSQYSQLEQPIVYAKPYDKPISPVYAAKLRHGDFTVANIHNHAQAESYQLMTERQITCYWFTKDNEPPKMFMCTIPNPPANFFHPKDDPSITAIISKDKCNPYAVLIGYDWVTTTAPQRVQPKDILCFRSLDVTICVGGPFAPTQTAKRRLSGDDDISPAKVSRHSSVDSVSTKTKKSTIVNNDQIILLAMLRIKGKLRTRKMPIPPLRQLQCSQDPVIVDWDVVNGLSEVNKKDNELEILLRSLMASENFTVPAEHIPAAPVALHDRSKKNQIANVDHCRFSYSEAWNLSRPWKFIIHDPKVDHKKNDPKLIVLDFAASEPDAGDLVVMLCFHLPVHVYTLELTHLDPSQVAAPKVTTFVTLTQPVLKALFSIWKPTEYEPPFAVAYTLLGYNSDDVDLLRFEDGWTAQPFDNAAWVPEATIRNHYLPLIGPSNAKCILLKVYPMPVSAPAPATSPAPAPGVSPAPKVPPEPTTPGAIYLLDRYRGRTSVIAMRSTDSDVGKSNVRVSRPVAVLVGWVRDVDDIMLKHENKKIPVNERAQKKTMQCKALKKGKKFIQRDFEVLFNRGWAWIEMEQLAAEAICERRDKLEATGDQEKLDKFDDFLADENPKNGLGVKTLFETVRVFGEEEDSTGDDSD
ncbi:hypothetical protein B0H13DRAFT_2321292 [Mycena leptocephala]|nr:hypothetical protein B0H13DRAFT_2321292 [Mycena leptocephala]